MRIILLYFVDQTDRRSGHTLHRTGKAQAFLGGRLDTDGVFLKAAGYGDISAHLVDIGRKLRRLRADRAVNVMRLEAGFLEHTDHIPQQLDAFRTLVFGIGIGKMLADISQRRRAQQRVHYGVDQNVRVGMTVESHLIWDLNAAEDQLTSFFEAMYVISVSDSHCITAFHDI